MRLALIALKNYNDVNSFEEVSEIRFQQGNPAAFYFRIVDLDQTTSDGKYFRFVPSTDATMTVTLTNIDTNNIVTKVASMPAQLDDRSIWSIPILTTDTFSKNSLSATLITSSVAYNLYFESEVSQDPSGANKFFC
jgi:hypothetical protein